VKLFSSLTNRVFVASALLVVISMGVVIYRVNVSVAAQAESDLRTGLDEAATLVEQVSRTRFADFIIKGELIADLPVLKAAAELEHAPTVQPIAQDYQAKIGGDLLAVAGSHGAVLARAGRIHATDEEVDGMIAACRSSHDGTVFWQFPGGLLHAAAIPLEPHATLLVGVSLDQQAASAIKAATNSDIAFMAGHRVVASTLTEVPGELAGAAAHGGVFTVPIGAEEYIARVVPLTGADEPDGPVAIVLRSRTQHLAFLPRLHWQIAATGLAAVLATTLLGYLVARTVTRPLNALTGAMRDMASTGDLARTLPPFGAWDDEDVRLVATTFHQLTSALDRFQREAAQRERLSSLGRLSTVVAHEVRNPLMIIKSAARTLRKQPSPDVVSASASIDEEVARINRVVSGVLDFARPIRFDLADADLVRIGRDALQAAASAGLDVPVKVDAPPTAPVVTDAERLRAVLVNLITNAAHAVSGRGASAPAPRITLTVRPAAAGRWSVSVADNGSGIADEHLAKVFDPFFTTRRAGSGLGLAIARNIIEGLGGSIALTSRVHEGTTVTIELPDRPPAEGGRA
jgi:signal transduction histidine kinase